jgi:hypothetical protein
MAGVAARQPLFFYLNSFIIVAKGIFSRANFFSHSMISFRENMAFFLKR